MSRLLFACICTLFACTAFADEDEIVWAAPAKPLQLGYLVAPDRDCHAVGDVLTVRLFVRNAGKESIEYAWPRLEILEKLGFDLELRDDHGRKLPWEWSRAHNEELTVSGAISETLVGGGIKELPPIYLLLGRDEQAAEPDKIHARLGVKPETRARLYFRISSLGIARGDEARLETKAFEFEVTGKM
jgi:hypothetical protein